MTRTPSRLAAVALFVATLAAPPPCRAAPPLEAGYSPRQRHPVLRGETPDAFHLDGVRWGFRDPEGAPEFTRATVRRGAVREGGSRAPLLLPGGAGIGAGGRVGADHSGGLDDRRRRRGGRRRSGAGLHGIT